MGWWIVSADTLAASRFVISPLAETTASLLVLHRREATHPGEKAWLDAYLPAYTQRLAGDPLVARAVRAALGRRWIADVFAPAPLGDGEQPFPAELAQIRAATPEQVAARGTHTARYLSPVLERAANGRAVARIFEAKGRPRFNPLIVHVRDAAEAAHHAVFNDGARTLDLVATDDILLDTIPQRPAGATIVGFALETGDAVDKGSRKLERKQLDLVVVNDASELGAGFEVDTNAVTIIDRQGRRESVPLPTIPGARCSPGCGHGRLPPRRTASGRTWKAAAGASRSTGRATVTARCQPRSRPALDGRPSRRPRASRGPSSTGPLGGSSERPSR